MSYNSGEQKETIISRNINNKLFKNLDNNSKVIVSTIFPNVKPEDTLISGIVEDYIKPDIYITLNGETHYISIKSGVSNNVHQEYLDRFCELIKSMGISDRTIETIKLFHYGDGTTDGSGSEISSDITIRKNLEDRFKEANLELNKDRKFVVDLVHRFIFKGTREENIEADYIFHGEPNFGIIVSKNQVLKQVEIKRYDFYENIHIGPIMFRPHCRSGHKSSRYPMYRQKMDFYWPNYLSDLNYIKDHYIR